ncbi:MAG: acyltransferase [Polyangiaceae bacterium]
MDREKPFKLGYRPALDGLRAFAIVAVLLNHTGPLIGWEILGGGSLGVDVFFVLSGFLISALLAEEWRKFGRIGLARFYGRRALRLAPALLVLLVVLALVAPKVLSSTETAETFHAIPIAAVYMTDVAIGWFGDFALGVLRHTWSLGTEEKFYFVWPALLVVGLRHLNDHPDRRRHLATCPLVLAFAVTLWRAALWLSDAPIWRLYYSSDTRADGLLVGCAAGLAVSWGVIGAFSRTEMLGAVAVLLLGVVATHFDTPIMYAGGFTVVGLASAIVTVNVVLKPSRVSIALLENPVAVWIGRASYALYLWHYFVFGAVAHLRAPWQARLALAILLTFLVAAASHYLVEAPLLRLKARLAPKASIKPTASEHASTHRH